MTVRTTLTEEETQLVTRLHRIVSDWVRSRYIPAPVKLFAGVMEGIDEIEGRVEEDVRQNEGLRARLADAFVLFRKEKTKEVKKHGTAEPAGEPDIGSGGEAGEQGV